MKRYFHYLRRQPHYVQRIHAGFFAGVITIIIASIWLYYQYGFWNDKYVIDSENAPVAEIKNNINKSPVDVLKNIYKESVSYANSINISPKTLIESSATINLDADVRR